MTLGEGLLDSVDRDQPVSDKQLNTQLERQLSQYRLGDKWQGNTVLRRALFAWIGRIRAGDAVEDAAHALVAKKHFHPVELLNVAEQFFPAHLYSLSRHWLKTKQLSKEELHRFAVNGDRWHLHPDSLAKTAAWEIETFDRTVSLSLNDVPPFDKGTLTYRPSKSEAWRSGLPVLPNPLQNSAGTVLYGLHPETRYDVQMTLFHQGKPVLTRTTQVETRTAPTFTEKNVYRLSELLKDGVLDLKQANRRRKPGEWIKVVYEGREPLTGGADSDAIRIENASHVYLEGLKLRGGAPHGLLIKNSHDVWVNGCDIAAWGRKAHRRKKGKAYAKGDADSPINYDAAIAIRRSGRVTVENCSLHSPRTGSNTWADGHPHGPTGILVDAAHASVEFQGQVVIRNNTIRASDTVRFNDGIESRHNGSMSGGFVRDSFIYGNTIAYANDDLIELDGSQRNVAVFENVFEHGLCAVSAIPNRQGPSFIVDNEIRSLGDGRGKSFTAIKLGGGLATPLGVTYVGHNRFAGERYFVAAAGYRGDRYFWAHFEDNHIVRKERKGKKKPPLHNFKDKRVDALGL